MRAQAWTAGRVDLLKRLWAEGETAAVIAARLGGMSRSAILGKVFRLRLGAADAAATRGATRPSAGQPGLASDATPARRHRSSKQENEQRSRPAPAARPKSVLELTNETCRWPHGRPGTERFFFCGAPEADLQHGVPYCARHMQRAYGTSTSGHRVEPAASGPAGPLPFSLQSKARPFPRPAVRSAGSQPV